MEVAPLLAVGGATMGSPTRFLFLPSSFAVCTSSHPCLCSSRSSSSSRSDMASRLATSVGLLDGLLSCVEQKQKKRTSSIGNEEREGDVGGM